MSAFAKQIVHQIVVAKTAAQLVKDTECWREATNTEIDEAYETVTGLDRDVAPESLHADVLIAIEANA